MIWVSSFVGQREENNKKDLKEKVKLNLEKIVALDINEGNLEP